MRAGDLARRCPPVFVTDSVGKAAEVMRRLGCPMLPVMDRDRHIVGVVDEETLLTLSLNGDGDLRVGEVIKDPPAVVMASVSPSQAAWLLHLHQASALPVVDEDGRLRGIITRSDITSVLLRGLRPPRLGGMATPFGVYLTTGVHRGGVGDFALMATGVVMALCLLAARLTILFGLYLIDGLFQTGLLNAYLGAYTVSVPLAPWGGSWLDAVPWIEILLFFTFLRLLPLTGYHGAEHQVVHAIERGEDLTIEAVSKMPLEHPRCGTNLAALVLLLSTILSAFFVDSSSPSLMVLLLLLLIATLLFWRQAGMLLQRLFTVKRPDRHQLLSGLRAGEELLQRFQHQPNRFAPIPLQIWNLGFIQIFLGAGLIWSIAYSIQGWLTAQGFPRFLF